MPPLYLPRVLLQEGQECVTWLRLSMQQGMQAQGQAPTKQSTPPMIQARALGSEEVLVVMLFWQWGHTMVTARCPKLGPCTYCTWVTTCTGGWGCMACGGGRPPAFSGRGGYIWPDGPGG